jgi:hypothetical protein
MATLHKPALGLAQVAQAPVLVALELAPVQERVLVLELAQVAQELEPVAPVRAPVVLAPERVAAPSMVQAL